MATLTALQGRGAAGALLAGLAFVACSAGPTSDAYDVNAAIWRSPEGSLLIAGYHGADDAPPDRGYVETLQNGSFELTESTQADLWGIWGVSSTDFFVFGGQTKVLRLTEGRQRSWDLGHVWSGKTDATLSGLWGTASSDVFTVGLQGTIARFDGTTWQAMDAPTAADLAGVWGTSSSNVIAVGASGTILRYDGTAWKAEASPVSAHLTRIWGSSPTDVFVVGETVLEKAHVILHYDGSAWGIAHQEATGLLSIHGAGPDCIYAVGGTRQGDDSVQSSILFFDGQSWSDVPDGAGQFLWDVWVMPGCDFYAVGPQTVIHRSH